MIKRKAAGKPVLTIWNCATLPPANGSISGELLAALPDGKRISLSPDGSRLISLGKDVQIWDVSPERPPAVLWNLPGFSGYPTLLSSNDHGQLVTVSNGAFYFWAQNGAAFAAQPTVINVPVTATDVLSASPNGKWLAFSTLDELVLGENRPDNPNWQTLEKFANLPYWSGAYALAFSPDSSMLAVADADRKVLLWRPGQAGAKPVEFAANIYIDKLIFSPDGKLLLGSGGIPSEATLYLWDTATGKLLRTWKTIGYQLAFHPNGVTLAATEYQNGNIRLLDLRTGDLLREMEGSPYARSIAFNPDGSLLAIACDEKLEIWETATGKLIKTIEGSFSQAVFSPNGKLLFTGLSDGRIQYWGLSEK